jgi:hypothetical protein
MARAFIAAVPLALVLVAALVVPVALTPGTFGFHQWPAASPQHVAQDPLTPAAPVAAGGKRQDGSAAAHGRGDGASRALASARTGHDAAPGRGPAAGDGRTSTSPAPAPDPAAGPAAPAPSASGPRGVAPDAGPAAPAPPELPAPATPADGAADGAEAVASGDAPVLRDDPAPAPAPAPAPPAEPEDPATDDGHGHHHGQGHGHGRGQGHGDGVGQTWLPPAVDDALCAVPGHRPHRRCASAEDGAPKGS